MTTLTAAVALALTLTVLHAQAVLNGQWQGQTPNSEPVTLQLTAKGPDLAGTITVGAEKHAIEQGKIAEASFTFTVERNGDIVGFAGEIMSDEIRLWLTERGPSSAITLRRVEPGQE